MKKLLNAMLLLLLTLTWATPVFAQEGREQPGQVVFGSDRRLEPGDIITGDLAIFGGDLYMAEGSRVEGDVVVFGGVGDISGEIDGDLAVIGGSAKLGPKARVGGDVASVGGEVDVSEGAFVRGDIIETTKFDFGRLPLPNIRAIPPRPQFDENFRFEPVNQFFRIMLAAARGFIVALVVSAIGLLVVIFLPQHTDLVAQTIRQAAPTSFGVGLLTLLVGGLALLLLFVTCCLAPVGVLVALALILAALYGWIVVGFLLGIRIMRAVQKDREPTPIAAALLGIFTVTIVQQGLMALGHLPCLGFFFWLLGAGLWLLVASIGLGAVVLSRFGTQPYTGPSPAHIPPPPLPPIQPSGLEGPTDRAPKEETRPTEPSSSVEREETDSPATEPPEEDKDKDI